MSAGTAFFTNFYTNFSPEFSAYYFVDQRFFFTWFMNINLILVIFYATIKIPLVIGVVMDEDTRGYWRGWRVHENIFGIAWVMVACLWVFFGNFYDRFFGLVFMLQGAFLIGKDHRDVQRFAFIEKQKSENGVEDV